MSTILSFKEHFEEPTASFEERQRRLRISEIHDLCQAGWTVEDAAKSVFRAPWGTLYCGPHAAWKVLQAHRFAEA